MYHLDQMTRSGRTRPRRPWSRTLNLGILLLPVLTTLGGCDPIFDIGGAFFPSWLFAVIVGIVGVVIVREVLTKVRIDEHLYGHGLAYLGVFVSISTVIWIWFFRT